MSNFEWDVESNVTTLPEYTSERGSFRSYTSFLIASGDPRYRYSTDALSLTELPPLPVAAVRSYQPPRNARPLPSLPLHSQLTERPPAPGQANSPIEVLIQESIQTPTEVPNERPTGESIMVESSVVPIDTEPTEPTEPAKPQPIFTLAHISKSFSSHSLSEVSVTTDIEDSNGMEVAAIIPDSATSDHDTELNHPSSQLLSKYSIPKSLLERRTVRTTATSRCCRVMFPLILLLLVLVAFTPIVVPLVRNHTEQ